MDFLRRAFRNFGMEVCVIGWVASRACYIGVIGLSEGVPVTRDRHGTNKETQSHEQDVESYNTLVGLM